MKWEWRRSGIELPFAPEDGQSLAADRAESEIVCVGEVGESLCFQLFETRDGEIHKSGIARTVSGDGVNIRSKGFIFNGTYKSLNDSALRLANSSDGLYFFKRRLDIGYEGGSKNVPPILVLSGLAKVIPGKDEPLRSTDVFFVNPINGALLSKFDLPSDCFEVPGARTADASGMEVVEELVSVDPYDDYVSIFVGNSVVNCVFRRKIHFNWRAGGLLGWLNDFFGRFSKDNPKKNERVVEQICIVQFCRNNFRVLQKKEIFRHEALAEQGAYFKLEDYSLKESSGILMLGRWGGSDNRQYLARRYDFISLNPMDCSEYAISEDDWSPKSKRSHTPERLGATPLDLILRLLGKIPCHLERVR